MLDKDDQIFSSIYDDIIDPFHVIKNIELNQDKFIYTFNTSKNMCYVVESLYPISITLNGYVFQFSAKNKEKIVKYVMEKHHEIYKNKTESKRLEIYKCFSMKPKD